MWLSYLCFQQVLNWLEQRSDAQQQHTASYYNSCPSHHCKKKKIVAIKSTDKSFSPLWLLPNYLKINIIRAGRKVLKLKKGCKNISSRKRMISPYNVCYICIVPTYSIHKAHTQFCILLLIWEVPWRTATYTGIPSEQGLSATLDMNYSVFITRYLGFKNQYLLQRVASINNVFKWRHVRNNISLSWETLPKVSTF